jgi:hypothetical protein
MCIWDFSCMRHYKKKVDEYLHGNKVNVAGELLSELKEDMAWAEAVVKEAEEKFKVNLS